jgi:hypothetical protein
LTEKYAAVGPTMHGGAAAGRSQLGFLLRLEVADCLRLLDRAERLGFPWIFEIAGIPRGHGEVGQARGERTEISEGRLDGRRPPQEILEIVRPRGFPAAGREPALEDLLGRLLRMKADEG